MAEGRKEGQLVNTLSTALGPLVRNLQSDSGALLPELALRCAQFFHSLSQYCLQYYRNDAKQKELLKTKTIRKEQKEQKEKGQRGRRKKEAEREEPTEKSEPPRKPLTAYIIYFQDKKQNFVERYPTLNLSELTKLIAKEWKELSDKERQVFLDRAAEDRRRYEEQMSEFKRLYGRDRFADDLEDGPEAAIDLDEEQQVQRIIQQAQKAEIEEAKADMDEELPPSPEEEAEQGAPEEVDVDAESAEEEQDNEGDRSSEEAEANESENNESSQSVRAASNEKEE